MTPVQMIVNTEVPEETKIQITNLQIQVNDLTTKLSESEEKLKIELQKTAEVDKEVEDEVVKRSAFSKGSKPSQEQQVIIEKLQTELKGLKNIEFEMSTKLEESKSKLTLVTKEFEEFKSETKQNESNLQDEIDIYVENIDDKEREVREIKEEMDRIREDLNEKSKEKKILNQEVIKNETEIIQKNCLIDDLEEEVAKLKKMLPGKALVGLKDLLVSQQGSTGSKKKFDSGDVSDMNKELEELRKSKAECMEQIDTLTTERNDFKAKWERREMIYKGLKEEYNKTMEERDNFEEDNKVRHFKTQINLFQYLEEQKNNLTDEKKDLLQRIVDLNVQIKEWTEKAGNYKNELVDKETKLIVSMMDMDDLMVQNKEYKKQINTPSMADLGCKSKKHVYLGLLSCFQPV